MIEFVISYIFGSVNFSLIISKILKLEIEKHGDENLGAMNLYYTSLDKYKDKKISFLLFLIAGLLDVLKAFIPTILFGPLAGAFAVIGHCFSVFSIIITKKFPSGIGAASSIGWLLALNFVEIFKIVIIVFPLLFIGFLIFRDVLEFDNLNIYTIFLFLSTALLYIYIFDPEDILKLSIILVALSVSFSSSLRSKIILKKLIKSKSPGGGI